MLKKQVQIVASKSPHSFIECTKQATHIKTLILNDRILVLWIMINLSDPRNLLILILTSMQYKFNSANTSAKAFARMIAIMNPIAVFAHFFELTYCCIFEHLLAAGSKDRVFLGLIFTYFGIVETNV